jgi:uncharacterized protein (DUF362 family)
VSRMDRTEETTVSRRSFLRTLAAAAGSVPFATSRPLWAALASASKPRVVTSIDPSCANMQGAADDNIDATAVRSMLDRGIMALTGEQDLSRAWKIIIPDPSKKVAVKVNLLNPALFTHRKVVDAVTDSIVQCCGLPPEQIIVFDRYVRENKRCAGYEPSMEKHKVRFMAVDQKDGPGWTESVMINGEPSRVAGFLGGHGPFVCDYVINIPVPNAHGGTVFSAAMKNHYGSIENPHKHHDQRLPRSLAALNSQACIRQKTRLIVGDAIFIRAEGPWSGGATSAPRKLVLGTDPVAFDRVCLALINEERGKLGLGPLTDIYLGTASSDPFELGESRLENIEWQNVNPS